MRAIRVMGIWAVSFAFVWMTPLESLSARTCTAIFALPPSTELPSTLVLATFNTGELGKLPERAPENMEAETFRQFEMARNKKLKHVINDLKSDVLVLTEVADPMALRQMVNRLEEKYSIFWSAGNDPHGLNVAMLLKTDLPLHGTYESHRNMKWVDPVSGKTEPLFIRDAPALILRKKHETAPYLIVIGVHSKSQRDRYGDPRSELIRRAEFNGYVTLIRGYQRRYGENTRIVLAGDFNTDVRFSPEMQILNETMVSSFDVAKLVTPPAGRITHTYHPRDGPTASHQIDDIRVLPFLKGIIEKAYVYRYRNENGTLRPFADSFAERVEQPSDHLPVVVEISTH